MLKSADMVDKGGGYGKEQARNLTIGILRSIIMELKMATPIIKPISSYSSKLSYESLKCKIEKEKEGKRERERDRETETESEKQKAERQQAERIRKAEGEKAGKQK